MNQADDVSKVPIYTLPSELVPRSLQRLVAFSRRHPLFQSEMADVPIVGRRNGVTLYAFLPEVLEKELREIETE